MNEIPFCETSEMALLCVDSRGYFYHEEYDGHATCPFWLKSPARAKRFDHIGYDGKLEPVKLPINQPDYYMCHPMPKGGCRMVLVKLVIAVWDKACGPPQPPEKKIESPFAKLMNQ